MNVRHVMVSVCMLLVFAAPQAWAQSGFTQKQGDNQGMKMPMGEAPAGSPGMKMPMSEEPTHFKPTRQAYTANHLFLVKLVTLPPFIPFQQYFELHFAVYDGKHPARRLDDTQIEVYAGMRHGLKHGFAHGMQSSPKVERDAGDFKVSGVYFHMMGP
jgi:hypothetical protein